MQHHATLYISPDLKSADLPVAVSVPSNDVLHEVFTDMLTVADARRLHQTAARMPVEKDILTLVVFATRIGVEAQNALLKLFEDPPDKSRFVLIVPTITMLLPTVRSRLQLETMDFVGQALSELGISFIGGSYKERFIIIDQLHKAEDRTSMRKLITDIGTYVARSQVSAECVSAVASALEYRDFPGASLKMWLEYLAQTLPIDIDQVEVVH